MVAIKKSNSLDPQALPYNVSEEDCDRSLAQSRADYKEMWGRAWEGKRKNGDEPLQLTRHSWRTIERMFQGLLDMQHGHMLVTSKRLKALEARPTVSDSGVWSSERAYKRAEGVTHSGAFWIAQKDTEPGAVPGYDHEAWRLAVKGTKRIRTKTRAMP